MKKFLSILLALAVGFTFTFGSAMSAFAGVDDVKASLAKACDKANMALEQNYKEAKAGLEDISDGTYKIEKAQAEMVLDAVYADYQKTFEKVRDVLIGYAANDGSNDGVKLSYYAADSSGGAAITADQLFVNNLYNAVKGGTTAPVAGNVASSLTTDSTVTQIPDYDKLFTVPTVKELITATSTAITTATGTITATGTNLEKAIINAYVAQFNIDRENAVKEINSADLSMYSENKQDAEISGVTYKGDNGSTSVPVDTTKVYTYKEAAQKAIEAIATAINAEAVDYNMTLTQIKAVFGKLKNLKANYTVAAITEVVTLDQAKVIGLKTAIQEDATNSSDAATKAQAKAQLALDIVGIKTTGGNVYDSASADVKALLNDWMDAFKTATEWLIDNGKTYGTDAGPTIYDVKTIAFIKDTTGSKNVYKYTTAAIVSCSDLNDSNPVLNNKLILSVKEASRALADVDRIKAEKNEDGSLKYDAELVDSTLAAFLTKAYTNYNGTVEEYTEDIYKAAAVSYMTAASKASYKNKIAALVAKDADGCNTYNSVHYYDLEWSEIEAAITAYNTAIDAATTTLDVTNAEKALNKTIAAIKNVNAVNALYKAALYKTFNNGQKDLKAYADYLNTGKTGDKKLVFVPDVKNDGTMIEYYAAKGVRTDAELTAAIAEVKTAMGSAKSVADIKADAAAIVAQIAALPAKAAITAADKDAVKAAWEANKAFADDYAAYTYLITNISTLNADVAAVKAAEIKAIGLATGKLPTVAKVAVSDRDAVAAVQEMIDAFADTEMYGAKNTRTTGYEGTVEKLADKIKALEFDALEKAVYAVPAATKVALTDKAAIEAARAAHDAYVKYYVEAFEGEYDAAELTKLNTFNKKIADAEAALAKLVEAEKWTADDAKAYVQDLSIAVRTAKVGKKVKVTVNADVQKLVDNGFTVEYKFYKSTKKSSGYKNTVNKTTNTYTNTNPVKGKNYYKVKLVVKNADGTVVATTPLTQCKYGVRTIK